MIFILFVCPFYYWTITYITSYSGNSCFKFSQFFIFSLAYVGNASGIQACMNSATLMLMALHQCVLYPIQVSLRCFHINQIHHHYNLQHDHNLDIFDDKPSSFSSHPHSYRTSYSSLAFKYNSISFAFCLHLIHSSLTSILLIYSPHNLYPSRLGGVFHPWLDLVCFFFVVFWSY